MAEVTVVPREYQIKTDLVLPIRARTIVFDGHDLYAHHRRIDPADPMVRKVLPYGNCDRYAYDLCPVDSNGGCTRKRRTKRRIGTVTDYRFMQREAVVSQPW